jgi:hypothetical protein
MKILICGSRNWDNEKAIRRELMNLILGLAFVKDILIIHGAAKGADSQAGKLAQGMNLAVRAVPADWNKHGRAAGPIRNMEMLRMRPDQVWAFTEDLSKSRGTAHTVTHARKMGIPVTVFNS